jgi:hypothetical protein
MPEPDLTALKCKVKLHVYMQLYEKERKKKRQYMITHREYNSQLYINVAIEY